MAKKKAAKKRAGSAGKKASSGGAKEKSAPAAKKGAAKKGAAASAKRAAPAAVRHGRPPGHHRQMRIGLSRNGNNPPPFDVNPHGSNTFTVYGEGIGARHPVNNPQHPKTVRLDSNSHDWQNPPAHLADAGPDGLRITATCNRRKRARNGTDDLIVTITYDGQDETDCQLVDVDYNA